MVLSMLMNVLFLSSYANFLSLVLLFPTFIFSFRPFLASIQKKKKKTLKHFHNLYFPFPELTIVSLSLFLFILVKIFHLAKMVMY